MTFYLDPSIHLIPSSERFSNLRNGLLATWKFDAGNATPDRDSDAGSYTLTQSGTMNYASTAGKVGGRVYTTNGTSGGLYIPDTVTEIVQLAQFTIGTWCKLPGLQTPAGNNTSYFGLTAQSSSNLRAQIYFYNATTGNCGVASRYMNAAESVVATTIHTFPAEEHAKLQDWFWMSMRYDGTTLTFDMVLADATAYSVPLTPAGGLHNSTARTLGIYPSETLCVGGTHECDGLAVWNRDIGAAGITAVLATPQYPFT